MGFPPGGPQGAGAWAGDQALPVDDRLTLADCDIQPAGTPIAYRGWLTLGDLFAAGRTAPGAGTPVYALVTEGPAEWVGWQTTEGRPMYPRPVGRMACAVDPLSGTSTVFSMADGWQPPAPMDGCPASPILRYAGDHQVGGPSAFILLPFDGEAWWSKTSIVLRVRIAPSPRTGSAHHGARHAAGWLSGHVAAGRQPTYPGVKATDLQPLPLAAAGALPDGWLLAGQRGGRRRRGGRRIVPITAPAG